jgi:hypothetical protein
VNARQLRDQVCAASTAAGAYTLSCGSTQTADALLLNDLLRLAYTVAARITIDEEASR